MNLRPSRPVGMPLGVVADLVSALPASGGTVADVQVTGVTLRGQNAEAGDLFAALPGASAHGGRYAAEAVARGAVAVLTDRDGVAEIAGAGGTLGVPILVHPAPRAVLGEVAAAVYGNPSDCGCGSSVSPVRPARPRAPIWSRQACVRRAGWPD